MSVLSELVQYLCQVVTRVVLLHVLTRSDKSTEYSVQLPGCDVATLDVVLRLIYTGDAHLSDAAELQRVIGVCTSLGVNLDSLHNVSITVEAFQHPVCVLHFACSSYVVCIHFAFALSCIATGATVLSCTFLE